MGSHVERAPALQDGTAAEAHGRADGRVRMQQAVVAVEPAQLGLARAGLERVRGVALAAPPPRGGGLS